MAVSLPLTLFLPDAPDADRHAGAIEAAVPHAALVRVARDPGAARRCRASGPGAPDLRPRLRPGPLRSEGGPARLLLVSPELHDPHFVQEAARAIAQRFAACPDAELPARYGAIAAGIPDAAAAARALAAVAALWPVRAGESRAALDGRLVASLLAGGPPPGPADRPAAPALAVASRDEAERVAADWVRSGASPLVLLVEVAAADREATAAWLDACLAGEAAGPAEEGALVLDAEPFPPIPQAARP